MDIISAINKKEFPPLSDLLHREAQNIYRNKDQSLNLKETKIEKLSVPYIKKKKIHAQSYLNKNFFYKESAHPPRRGVKIENFYTNSELLLAGSELQSFYIYKIKTFDDITYNIIEPASKRNRIHSISQVQKIKKEEISPNEDNIKRWIILKIKNFNS